MRLRHEYENLIKDANAITIDFTALITIIIAVLYILK